MQNLWILNDDQLVSYVLSGREGTFAGRLRRAAGRKRLHSERAAERFCWRIARAADCAGQRAVALAMAERVLEGSEA